MGKDGCDYSRIRLFWYVTKITLRWNVVQSCIFDIFELCGLWCNQEESYEVAKISIKIIFYQEKWCLQINIFPSRARASATPTICRWKKYQLGRFDAWKLNKLLNLIPILTLFLHILLTGGMS